MVVDRPRPYETMDSMVGRSLLRMARKQANDVSPYRGDKVSALRQTYRHASSGQRDRHVLARRRSRRPNHRGCGWLDLVGGSRRAFSLAWSELDILGGAPLGDHAPQPI